MFIKKIVLFLAVYVIILGSIIFYQSVKLYNQSQFKWGIYVNPFDLGCTNRENYLDECHQDMVLMLEKAKELGVNWVRVNAELSPEINKMIIEETEKFGLKLVLIMEHGQCANSVGSISEDQNLYQKGFDCAKELAGNFAGKVAYYQIANEISGATMALSDADQPFFGNKIGNAKFSEKKYQPLETWMKGAYDAIRQFDPKAKIAVSGHWILISVFDRLIQDGIDFDAIGWNWYSEDDDIRAWNIDGKKYDVLGDYLATYGKEIWLSETNRPAGDFDGNSKEQAKGIYKTIKKVYESGKVSGVFVFKLTDSSNIGRDKNEIDSMGLARILQNNQKNSNGYFWELGASKIGFSIYQDIIKMNPYLSTYQPNFVINGLKRASLL